MRRFLTVQENPSFLIWPRKIKIKLVVPLFFASHFHLIPSPLSPRNEFLYTHILDIEPLFLIKIWQVFRLSLLERHNAMRTSTIDVQLCRSPGLPDTGLQSIFPDGPRSCCHYPFVSIKEEKPENEVISYDIFIWQVCLRELSTTFWGIDES